MIIKIITIFFSLLDLVIIVGCALALVKAIPSNIEESRWKKILAWIGYGVLAVVLPVFGKNDMLTIGILMVYYIFIAWLLYFRNKMGMLYQMIYCVLMLLVQYIAALLAAYFWTVKQLEDITYVCLLVVLRSFFLLTGTLLLRGMVHRRFTDVQYTKIRGMVIVPIFSSILLFLYLFASDAFSNRYEYYWLLIYCILLLVINLYCLYFWYDVAKNGELKHRLEMMQQQSELTLQYYEDLEDNYNRSRKIIHDIRNHLHVIEQSSRMESNPYIEDVHAMLNSLGMKFYTENRMLNIVLNDKLKGLSQEQVDCNLGGIGLEFISDLDITTIFANLLDNAVEAREAEKEFWIKIRGEQIQDFTIIKILNPTSGSYREGKSSKPGHEGLGLQNVRQALEKYRGELEIRQEREVFSVTLLFAGNELEEKDGKLVPFFIN